MIADGINAGFEFLGAITQWLNVRRLLKDKQIRGVDWRFTAFFASWGLWNLVYYPSLHQWLSTAAGAVIVAANIVWVTLAVKFKED